MTTVTGAINGPGKGYVSRKNKEMKVYPVVGGFHEKAKFNIQLISSSVDIMAEDKPTAAFVLSLIGGIFVLLVGIFEAVVGAYFLAFLGAVGAVVLFLGVVWGLLMIVGAVMMYVKPEQHTVWGIIVVVFSIVSWYPTLGGFFIGFILGLIGGILGLTFKPSAHATQSGTAPPS